MDIDRSMIKIDSLLWLQADNNGTMLLWPAIIKGVTNNSFSTYSLDVLKDDRFDLRDGFCFNRRIGLVGMRTCTLKEARYFLEEKRKHLEHLVGKRKKETEKAETQLKEHQESTKDFLKTRE